MKKIAVLNDLSGMGKCSLTAAIPVISVMGIQACPLPTAVLSAQTGFPSYYCDDYTDRMDAIMEEWKKMDFYPDGIYTGFLADARQADKAVEFIEQFAKEDTKILIDPVMGDNGEEYPIYTEALCEKMRFLVKKLMENIGMAVLRKLAQAAMGLPILTLGRTARITTCSLTWYSITSSNIRREYRWHSGNRSQETTARL